MKINQVEQLVMESVEITISLMKMVMVFLISTILTEMAALI